ncbi:MAG: dephospho-CoA kinase [Flavobacteriales bacterium]
MIKVGSTGGIGSGKTIVGRIFRVLGVPVFEADVEGRRLLAEDEETKASVLSRFGPEVFRSGAIDRAALGRLVFNDPLALRDLNAIIHPLVRKAFQAWAEAHTAPYVLMESAILAESGGHKGLDQVIVVTAPEPLRIRRVMERDGVEEEAVRARLANQTDEAGRLAIADHVIYNDDTQLVIPQVLRVHQALLQPLA